MNVNGLFERARPCKGTCRQAKALQDAILEGEHGRKSIGTVLVNSGCAFIPDPVE